MVDGPFEGDKNIRFLMVWIKSVITIDKLDIRKLQGEWVLSRVSGVVEVCRVLDRCVEEAEDQQKNLNPQVSMILCLVFVHRL